jgi:hypothetical protein
MPTFMLTSANSPLNVNLDGGAYVKNLGSVTVSYADTQDVLSSVDGTIAAGATTLLVGSQFFYTTGARADLQVTPINAPIGDNLSGLVTIAAPQDPTLITGVQVFAAANTGARGCRVVCPKDGTLRDFSVYIGVSSGNLIGGIYDTGDTTSGVRTKLWDSGSVAAGTGGGWQTLGDPALNVRAGQHLDYFFLADNTTVSLGRSSVITNNAVSLLPTNFMPVAGAASPRLVWALTTAGFAAPATIADGSLSGINFAFVAIARIV